MSRKMPAPDSALSDFFADNEVFAALFNAYIFGGRQVIKPEKLIVVDSVRKKSVKKGKGIRKVQRNRDIIRKTDIGYLVILGVEGQDKIHYSMPVRNMLYDALEYVTELAEVETDTDTKVKWTADEILSETRKGTKIPPMVTVVFYTGENRWDGPHSLHEMIEMDESVRPFVPDYPINIIDIGHDEMVFGNRKLEDLRSILSSMYNKTADSNKREVYNSMLSLSGILSGSSALYNLAISKSEGGKSIVCNALQEMISEKIEEEKARADAAKARADEEKARADALEKENKELRAKLLASGISPD